MRLNNYLTEKMEQMELFPDDFYKFGWQNGYTYYLRQSLNLIKAECSQIIQEYDKMGRILFRGTNSKRMTEISENIFKVYPRNDRRPKDTSWKYQEDIDYIFNKKFGWKPRAEGAFVIGLASTASTYGKLYGFFPINGYKYLWSDKYDDLYSDYFENKPNEEEYDPFANGGHWEDGEGDTINIYYLENDDDFIRKEYYNDSLNIKLYYKNPDNKNHYIIKHIHWVPNLTKEDWENTHITDEDVVDTYNDANLRSSMCKQRTEIMFKCKYYYLIKFFRPHTYNYQMVTVKDLGLL